MTRAGLIWTVFILILYLLPGRDIPSAWWLELISADKWVHAGLFSVHVLLLTKGFEQQRAFNLLRNKAMVFSMTTAAIYGLVLELMQKHLLIGRTFDWFDELANCAGCLAAFILLRFYRHRLPDLLKYTGHLN